MFNITKVVTLLVTLVFFSLIPATLANAHSVLEKATPMDGAQVEETIKTMELTFNTKIENGSTLYLVKDNEGKIEPASINLSDNTLKATFSENLTAGTYQVNWKILGEDGHIIENQYSFSINDQKENVQSRNEEGQQNNTENSPNDGTATPNEDKDTGSKNSTGDLNNENDSSLLVYGIISLLIIAAIILFAWMWISKGKK
jgi:copper resistance protein C